MTKEKKTYPALEEANRRAQQIVTTRRKAAAAKLDDDQLALESLKKRLDTERTTARQRAIEGARERDESTGIACRVCVTEQSSRDTANLKCRLTAIRRSVVVIRMRRLGLQRAKAGTAATVASSTVSLQSC